MADGGVVALAVYGNKLIAGGGFTTAGGVSAHGIASWNGYSWSALGLGMNGSVYALAVYDNKLIAGGYFTTAGGRECQLYCLLGRFLLVSLGVGDVFGCLCPGGL